MLLILYYICSLFTAQPTVNLSSENCNIWFYTRLFTDTQNGREYIHSFIHTRTYSHTHTRMHTHTPYKSRSKLAGDTLIVGDDGKVFTKKTSPTTKLIATDCFITPFRCVQRHATYTGDDLQLYHILYETIL